MIAARAVGLTMAVAAVALAAPCLFVGCEGALVAEPDDAAATPDGADDQDAAVSDTESDSQPSESSTHSDAATFAASSRYVDISAGRGPGSGVFPSAVIDSANAKLLVVTEDLENMTKASLFRCSLDGTNCTFADLSAGRPGQSGYNPSAAIDTQSGKLVVSAHDDATKKSHGPGIFRCDLDGSSCGFSETSPLPSFDVRYP
jgi:hypothetical protein